LTPMRGRADAGSTIAASFTTCNYMRKAARAKTPL
jgi:hypothetical protein